MPHNRKRASVQPRFLVESPANTNAMSIKSKPRASSKKLPIDMQIFRIMGNTVTNSAQEYPLVFPEFVSRFIAANADESETVDAKKRSWKIIAEIGNFRQQNNTDDGTDSVQQGSNGVDSSIEKRTLQLTESASCNSLSSLLNSPTADHRSAQMIAFAQAKVSGGSKKLVSRSISIRDTTICQSLTVGGRSISRPNTPSISVPFIKGSSNGRTNSISATSGQVSAKTLSTPVYAQLLTSAPSLSSNTTIPNNSSNINLQKSNSNVTESLQRPLPLSAFPSKSSASTDLLPVNPLNNSNSNSNSESSLVPLASTNSRGNISAINGIAFSRNARVNTRNAYVSKASVSVPVCSGAHSFSSTKYADPLYGMSNPSNSMMNDLYRRRIDEIRIFTEQTIRFEQRKAAQQRLVVHRSVPNNAPLASSSSTNNFITIAHSPSQTPAGRYFQQPMSPIEPRNSPTRNKSVDEDASDEEDDDGSDTS